MFSGSKAHIPKPLSKGDENHVKQRFWEERGHRGMTTSSRDALGHPKPHHPPGPSPSSLDSDSSEAPPGRGGEAGEERGEAPPRRGWARGTPGPPQNAAIAGARACYGPGAEGRVPTHRLQRRSCPGAPSTARAAATAPSARTCPCCPPGWCRHRRRCRRSLRTTSYQPFGEEEGGGGGEGGGEEEGEGVRSREHGERGRSGHPFLATCTLYSPPASHQPPTRSPPPPRPWCERGPCGRKIMQALQRRGRRGEGTAREEGAGSPFARDGRGERSGAPTQAAAGAPRSSAGTPEGELSPAALACAALPRAVRRVRGQVATCVREWQWLGLPPPPLPPPSGRLQGPGCSERVGPGLTGDPGRPLVGSRTVLTSNPGCLS